MNLLISILICLSATTVFANNEVTVGEAPYCKAKAREVVRNVLLSTMDIVKVSTTVKSFAPQGDGAEYYETFVIQVNVKDSAGNRVDLSEKFVLKFWTESDFCTLEEYKVDYSSL